MRRTPSVGMSSSTAIVDMRIKAVPLIMIQTRRYLHRQIRKFKDFLWRHAKLVDRGFAGRTYRTRTLQPLGHDLLTSSILKLLSVGWRTFHTWGSVVGYLEVAQQVALTRSVLNNSELQLGGFQSWQIILEQNPNLRFSIKLPSRAQHRVSTN
jgi:hypothetical protein